MPKPWERNWGTQNVAPNPLYPGQQTVQQQTIQQNAATLPYAAPKAAADTARAQVGAQVDAATAPADIASKAANARRATAEATAAEANTATTGGAGSEQAKAASFYNRALKANQLYGGTGVKDEPMGRRIAQTLLPDSLVNEFTGPARQQAEAAQRDFIAASLRYESGAAIAPSEFENQRKIYFPQPGDDPKTIAFKAQLRQNQIEGLRLASGPAAPILDNGKADYSGMVPQGFGYDRAPLAAGAESKQVADPDANAFVDSMVRANVPYAEAIRQVQQRFPNYQPIDPAQYNKALEYQQGHPGSQVGYTHATKNEPVGLVEQGINGFAQTAPGAMAGHTLNSLLAGLPQLAAGDRGQYFDAVSRQQHPVASTLGDITGATGGFLGANKLLEAAAPSLGAAGRFATASPARSALTSDVLFGAGSGAAGNPDNPLLGAGMGAAAAGVGNVGGQAAARTLGSLISPTGGKLASLYEMGVRPSIGQRMGGLVNNLEEKLQSIPLLGDAIAGTRQRARDQYQIGLFNDALGEIGQQLPKDMKPGHAPHAFAQDAFSNAYASAERGMTAAADGQLATDLGALQRTVDTLRPESQGVFNKVWSGAVGRRFAGGSLSGEAYKDAMSELSKKVAGIRKNPSGDHELADALDEAMTALRGSATRNSPPEAVAALDAADRGYAKLVRLEEASRKAGDPAEFSPTQYNTAVKTTSGGVRNRGYLRGDALNTEIAAAGTRLGDKVSNSGTVDRYAPLAIASGIGGYYPPAAAGLGIYGLLNAPGVRQVVTGLMAPRGGKAKVLGDLIRKQKRLAGAAGSGVGLGLLPSS